MLLSNNMDPKIRLACVGVVCNSDQQVLLISRHKPDHHTHGKWHCPGGGLEFGEEPKSAVIREVKEETGYDIKLLSTHPAVFSEVRADEKKQIILFSFPAQVISGTVDSSDDGVGEIRWFDYDEIPFSDTLPFTKEMIDSVLPDIKKPV